MHDLLQLIILKSQARHAELAPMLSKVAFCCPQPYHSLGADRVYQAIDGKRGMRVTLAQFASVVWTKGVLKYHNSSYT